MKVKIISDGTSEGTKVVNAETGDAIEYVQNVEFSISVNGVAKCTLEILFPEVDVECEAN